MPQMPKGERASLASLAHEDALFHRAKR
jgi:hypothetical protein